MTSFVDEVELPNVQPKGFKHALLVSPTRDGNSSRGAYFVSRHTGTKRVHIGSTPDMRRGCQRSANNNNDYSDGISTTAIISSATSNDNKAQYPTPTEREQKSPQEKYYHLLVDKYYRFSCDSEEEFKDKITEALNHRKLSNLKRTHSAGPRSASRLNNVGDQDYRNHGTIDTVRGIMPLVSIPSSTPVTATQSRPSRTKNATTPMNNNDFETLKVAGFWSQFESIGLG